MAHLDNTTTTPFPGDSALFMGAMVADLLDYSDIPRYLRGLTVLVDEVAERLRVTVWTVREWCKNNRIRAIKPWKQFLIPQSALDEFENSNGHQPNGNESIN